MVISILEITTKSRPEDKGVKYKISNVYAVINGEKIQVGVALGKEDKPKSPFMTECITNTEYERGLKELRYGEARIDDLVCHTVARFENFVSERPVEERWITELKLMGYDVSKLVYENN